MSNTHTHQLEVNSIDPAHKEVGVLIRIDALEIPYMDETLERMEREQREHEDAQMRALLAGGLQNQEGGEKSNDNDGSTSKGAVGDFLSAFSSQPEKTQGEQQALQKKKQVSDHIAEEIYAAIDSAQHIVLVMHKKPDGDTAGSSLGLSHYLDSIHKSNAVFCVDPIPPALGFLPGKEKISTQPYHWSPDATQLDLIIALDSGDLGRSGIQEQVAVLKAAGKQFRIINIDHHATNTNFGDINLVVPTASSTCEIVYELLEWRNGLTKKASECLMTGLLTDTGHFMNMATTASAVETAASLMSEGVNLHKLSARTMNNRPLNTLHLWGRALERLQQTEQGIAYTVVTQNDIDECNATQEAVDGISNFLNSLDQEQDARAVLVLTDLGKGEVKGSLRTTHPDHDVSKLAQQFGGGGHKKAAGFTVSGQLVQLLDGAWGIQQRAELKAAAAADTA